MQTNYSKHATVWDWDEYDRSAEFGFWYKMGSTYGKHILSAMGAIGQAGAYLAKKDCHVTVLDYTKEMIEVGRRQFSDIDSLSFIQADICDFDLKDKDYDFCFIASADLHVLPSLESVRMALRSINKHLRIGGGLGLELWYPSDTSYSVPMKKFEPRVPRRDGSTIWKEGESHYDAISKKQEIHQVVYIKVGDTVENFDHFVTLHLYDRDELFRTIQECGFRVVAEYSDYGFNKNKNQKANCFIELSKQ
ncbi:MAG: class I SAM-dependent methyltransferase [Candidatus Latescibacterota bacterium]